MKFVSSCFILRKRLLRDTTSSTRNVCNNHQQRYCNNNRMMRLFSSSNMQTTNNDNNNNNNNVVSVEIDKNTGITHVILNRPDKLNALDMNMFYGIQNAAKDILSNTSKHRVIILRGNGRAFCTGLDIPSIIRYNPISAGKELLQKNELKLQNDDDDGDVEEPNLQAAIDAVAKTTNIAQNVGYLWRQIPVPVLCCIHGYCFGGGLQIALGADIRFCTTDATISIMESKWGLIPDMSATITLRELVPIDIIKELTFTGRKINGIKAKELGLVTHVVDDDDPLIHAEKLALQLIEKSPDALKLAKQLYQSTYINATEEQCLQIETDYQKQLLASWNQIAASGRNFGWKIPYRSIKKD